MLTADMKHCKNPLGGITQLHISESHFFSFVIHVHCPYLPFITARYHEKNPKGSQVMKQTQNSYGGTMTSNSGLQEAGHILEHLPRRVTSVYHPLYNGAILGKTQRSVEFLVIALNLHGKSLLLHIQLMHAFGKHSSVPAILLFIIGQNLSSQYYSNPVQDYLHCLYIQASKVAPQKYFPQT